MSTSGAERVLYRFLPHNTDNGHNPAAGLLVMNDELYGTTMWGGGPRCGWFGNWGCGTVFRIRPSGQLTWLYRFEGPPGDGSLPIAGLLGLNGALYGTTEAGGTGNSGAVVKVTTRGLETVIHSFTGYDGAGPYAGVTAVGDTLYGTTYYGGMGRGNVFAMNKAGLILWQYPFKGYPTDGEEPWAGLAAVDGVLYGTTEYGGAHNTGTVFSISTTGTEQTLYSFGSHPDDGYFPQGDLVAFRDNLYGTTENGGDNNNLGTVFKITTSGNEKVIYRFEGQEDGQFPLAGLVVLNGRLYGTTYSGGMTRCAAGCGTIFSVTPSGREHVVYRLRGGTDGQNPEAPLVAFKGELYGTTYVGGSRR